MSTKQKQQTKSSYPEIVKALPGFDPDAFHKELFMWNEEQSGLAMAAAMEKVEALGGRWVPSAGLPGGMNFAGPPEALQAFQMALVGKINESNDNGSRRLAQELLRRMDAASSPAEALAMFTIFWSDTGGLHRLPEVRAGFVRHLENARIVGADFRDFIDRKCRRWFDRLPQELTVYRGFPNGEDWAGLSWATDYETAVSFAEGHGGMCGPNPTVIEMVIDKSDVIFATNDRDEQEILLRPMFSGEKPGSVKIVALAKEAA